MGPVEGRRNFIKGALGCVLGGALADAGSALAFAGSRPASLGVSSLTDSLTLIQGAGGNVVLLTGADSALLIDGGRAEHSSELLKLVAKHAGGRPVEVLFNTHWHWDHTGSNERLGRSGARIIAHENTKLWLGTEFYVEWQDREYPPRPPEALPNETFYTAGELSFAGERIVYAHLPRAHTDSDIYVFLPGPNVLVAGDLLSVGSYPILDFSTGGWIGGLTEATRALIDLSDEHTRVIPGKGPVQTRTALQTQHEMLETMRERLVGMMKKGMSAQDMLDARATHEFDAQWGDPTLFVANAYRGMWGHVRYLGGIV